MPQTEFPDVDVYLQVPTTGHRSRVGRELSAAGFTHRRVDDGLLVEGVSFSALLASLDHIFTNEQEASKVYLLPLERGAMPDFASLHHHRPLAAWRRLVGGREIIDLIADGRIRTDFQPIVLAATGEIFGYEALSRGVRTDGSDLAPHLLFSRAREMDLLFPLDRACRTAAIRSAAAHNITKRLFINFLPTAIYQPSLCLQTTDRALAQTELQAGQIVFEVVESERVDNFAHLNEILDHYRARGYSTALDDIGSGYSDVQALLRLRPDFMKIDLDIVRDVEKDPAKQALVEGFIAGARRVGASVLAEGVETPDEYWHLREQGVELMQGYLFGRPQPVPATTVSMPTS